MVEKDSFDHVVKTTAQWESQSFEYWIIPRGVLCVELTPDKKTKIKIGEGNKIYSQLPYINSETDLSDYYTKEEIDNILAMLNFVAIPSSEIYPTKEALPQTGNRQGDLRFVLNTTGDPYEYLWFDNKWIALGGDLSEYAKKSEVNPRLNALELKAHTHVNKNVLDRLTANVIDDSHKHANKNILDATTASYTTQDKATLDELAAITIFEGATKTEDGTMGYVPAPLHGQHTYFLKGDGTWAYLDPGDKYKAGEGIYILSGEVTAQTFPFKLYAKGGYVKQYIIYGAPGGVGEWNATTQTYHIPIRVSAEGHTSIDTVIQVRDKLYEGDWINFETQEYSVYRTNLTSQFQNLMAINEMSGIDTAGNFNKPPGYWPQFALSDYYEIDPDAKYEIPELDDWSYTYANVNMYDANKNRTRTILRSRTSKVQIIPLLGEKYIRIAGWVDINFSTNLHTFRDPVIYQLKDTISPVPTPLQQIQLIPNAINTIDVLTTTKPLDVYMETYIPEEPDPEDPLSGYSGIIYNDGVLDVTQEDPNALNELTVHFRENVEKTLTIPTYELPIASDTTLGGIKVGANLTIDENGVLDAITKSGDKYKAGEGITILSGEVISDTFPFEIFPKAATVTQYVIYGTASGVGNLVSGHYEVPIKVSAPGYSDIIQTISIADPLYDGDYIDFQKQVFAHYRTEVTSQITTDPAYSYKKAIYSDGVIRELDPGAYGDIPRVSRVYELMSGATYELTPWNVNGYSDFNRFRVGQYLNIYDADMNITRTLYQEHLGNTMIIVGENEKYMRMTVRQWGSGNVLTYQHLYRLYPMETPCALQALTLHPGVVNTVDVLTTNKPNEIYVEVVPPDDEDTDPDDPMSDYTGIIYNDGVLDITQDDPNALNELTVHFRDNVDKTLTIPSAPLPIASDTTLGGIKVGNNLTIDPATGVLDATGGTTYVEGQGIEFSRPILETYQVLDKIRKPSGTTLTTDVMPSGTVDFFCDLKYYKYAGGTSFLILCYDGERGSFCYTAPVTNSSNSTRMWIYTAHENWYDLYLYDSVQSSNPITVHLRWGNTMSISFDHTTRSAQNSPGVLPGHNRFKFDTSSDADLYWARFYENSALVGELVPVIRQSDNVVGLFNKVTETFSTVSGLIAGTPTGETIVVYDPSSTQNIPINAKLGNGLDFDSNDAIEVVPATASTIGGIIVGDGLSVDNTGEISVDEMTGADGTNAGTAGIVPAPGAADNTKFLRGDGTWVEVSGGGSDYVEGNGIEFIPSSITPTGYQTVEYIQSTGTQAIILGYTPSSQNVKIKLTFSDINNSASGWHYMYGGWDTDSIRPPSVAYQQNGSNLVVAIGNELAIQNGEYPSTSGVHTSTLITLNGNYVSLQLDAGTISSSSFGGSIYRPMALFAQTNSSGTTVAEFGSYKFHEMEIYEDDILIHHYYPCYRLSDDEIGIYDIIENVFLTNSGTGTFIRSNTPVYIDGPDSINAKLGNGLQFDANGAIETIAATEYAAGDGIQIDPGTSVIDITSIQWQQGKIDDTDGSEAITGVEPYLDCEMFEITSHTSMVTLSGTYDNNIMLLWKPYYYDENDDYISTVNTWSTYEDGVQIPINAKYVRFVLTKDETTTLDPNDLAHVEIEYPLEVGKDVITNTGVIDIQVRDRKLIIIKHNAIEEIPIPDPPLATTSTPGIVTVGQDLTIDQNGVLNIADINRLILNAEE